MAKCLVRGPQTLVSIKRFV
ncbi:hypothetical protein ZYGR_0P01390 [Zygosaccharomyces rouxii]|uniref:Uncharacterized protein n=1 Tax=Zygosaccharomyces rouxii TaxID=4956 RepID=A0A1Q3A1B3_ZYGRO|nr:hypothetical protein ZYGR_0P01390 [Zygosaccharomyces rouxii]